MYLVSLFIVYIIILSLSLSLSLSLWLSGSTQDISKCFTGLDEDKTVQRQQST